MDAIQNTSSQKKPVKIKRAGLHIDMTPMVDVAMLLLTFFMLTAVFNKPQAMELNLPASQDSIAVAEDKLVTLFVDCHSQIFTQNGSSDNISHLPFDRLRSELANLKNRKPDIIALIKIDRRARYEKMIDLLDELNCSAIDRFSIAPLSEKDKHRLQDVSIQGNNPI